VNAEQAPKAVTWEPTRHSSGEGRRRWDSGWPPSWRPARSPTAWSAPAATAGFGTRDDRILALRSTAYDAGSMAATLTPKGRTMLNQPLQLVVRDSALVDLALNALDGDGDNRVGGDYVGRFGARPRA